MTSVVGLTNSECRGRLDAECSAHDSFALHNARAAAVPRPRAFPAAEAIVFVRSDGGSFVGDRRFHGRRSVVVGGYGAGVSAQPWRWSDGQAASPRGWPASCVQILRGHECVGAGRGFDLRPVAFRSRPLSRRHLLQAFPARCNFLPGPPRRFSFFGLTVLFVASMKDSVHPDVDACRQHDLRPGRRLIRAGMLATEFPRAPSPDSPLVQPGNDFALELGLAAHVHVMWRRPPAAPGTSGTVFNVGHVGCFLDVFGRCFLLRRPCPCAGSSRCAGAFVMCRPPASRRSRRRIVGRWTRRVASAQRGGQESSLTKIE